MAIHDKMEVIYIHIFHNIIITDILWNAYGLCAAWLDVSNELGFFVDFSGGLLCGIAGSIIFDWELFPAASIHKRIAASTSITLLLVLAAFHKTGGFFHPLLAFARTFGCVGMLRPVSLLDHVLVYWLAASLGPWWPCTRSPTAR